MISFAKNCLIFSLVELTSFAYFFSIRGGVWLDLLGLASLFRYSAKPYKCCILILQNQVPNFFFKLLQLCFPKPLLIEIISQNSKKEEVGKKMCWLTLSSAKCLSIRHKDSFIPSSLRIWDFDGRIAKCAWFWWWVLFHFWLRSTIPQSSEKENFHIPYD